MFNSCWERCSLATKDFDIFAYIFRKINHKKNSLIEASGYVSPLIKLLLNSFQDFFIHHMLAATFLMPASKSILLFLQS